MEHSVTDITNSTEVFLPRRLQNFLFSSFWPPTVGLERHFLENFFEVYFAILQFDNFQIL